MRFKNNFIITNARRIMGLFDRFSKKNKREEESAQQHEFNPETWFLGTFLKNESKFRHQDKVVKRSSKDEPMTLGYIIQELLNIPASDIGSMTIVARNDVSNDEKTVLIESPADVLNFKPYDAILYVDEEGKTHPKTGQNTVLIISYRSGERVFGNIENREDKSKLNTNNSIIMYLRGIGPFVYETAYMRVSVMIPNFSDSDDFRTIRSKNAPFTTSFILCFDIVSPGKKLKKYAEVEASILEKNKQGEKLTPDEKSLLEGLTYSKSIGQNFGYGRWLVSENRFADALTPLMKAYDQLRKAIITDFDKARELFAETCFNIGFCFNELEQFDRAFYFLDLIQPFDRITYVIEYINSMVNNCDPRAMHTVRNYLEEFKNGKRVVDSEETSFFYNFLARRLAYLYIEYEMWDDARHLLEQLKETEPNHDFACEELRYIDRVMNNQK